MLAEWCSEFKINALHDQYLQSDNFENDMEYIADMEIYNYKGIPTKLKDYSFSYIAEYEGDVTWLGFDVFMAQINGNWVLYAIE